jgi:LDH2 family malate/lactate/ureidoglycolate dehydrogenase
MYVVDSKRLTHAGVKKMMATAIAKAEEAGIAISAAIATTYCYKERKRREGGLLPPSTSQRC